eukprot:NODE_24476_length_623_cov_6.366935.p1 GENE.NODE_24476_length_623_cov_6.366935~~NODE_24476_length_623_cov_6.366935.p1  ORF type:complete len:108 (+),score=29.06 NODE_24476_length_623_cov_6.366935:167-490(+)
MQVLSHPTCCVRWEHAIHDSMRRGEVRALGGGGTDGVATTGPAAAVVAVMVPAATTVTGMAQPRSVAAALCWLQVAAGLTEAHWRRPFGSGGGGGGGIIMCADDFVA